MMFNICNGEEKNGIPKNAATSRVPPAGIKNESKKQNYLEYQLPLTSFELKISKIILQMLGPWTK